MSTCKQSVVSHVLRVHSVFLLGQHGRENDGTMILETSVTAYQLAWHYISEDVYLQPRNTCCGNFRSFVVSYSDRAI
jgi:hypothetical protein